MKFYLKSGNFTTKFKKQGEINIGDTFQTIVKKYADKETNQFIGNTYAYYRVLETTKIGNNLFNTICYSNRQLVFDSRGIIMSNGISTQNITIDNNNNILDLKIIKNNMNITNGTGEFEGIKATYHPRSISPHFYEANIEYIDDLKLIHILVGIIFLYIIYCVYNNKKL